MLLLVFGSFSKNTSLVAVRRDRGGALQVGTLGQPRDGSGPIRRLGEEIPPRPPAVELKRSRPPSGVQTG